MRFKEVEAIGELASVPAVEPIVPRDVLSRDAGFCSRRHKIPLWSFKSSIILLRDEIISCSFVFTLADRFSDLPNSLSVTADSYTKNQFCPVRGHGGGANAVFNMLMRHLHKMLT